MIREFPDHVATGTPEGIAQSLADRMREARERRVAGRAAPTEALPARSQAPAAWKSSSASRSSRSRAS